MQDQFVFYETCYEEVKEEFISAWCSSFDREIPVEIFNWLFGSSSRNRIFIARCQETKLIAGGYCLLPQKACIRGQMQLSFLCNNVFTVPQFRTFNIFVKLGRFALDRVSQDGSLAIGIPNKLALPGHKRVGWHMSEPIKFVEINSDAIELKNNTDIDIQDINTSELSLISQFYSSVMDRMLFSIVKDERYIRWRYFERPEISRTYYRKKILKKGKIVGYLILSYYHPGNKLHIIDLCTDSQDTLRYSLKFCNSLAKHLKANCINMWGSPYFLKSLPEDSFLVTNDLSNLIIKDLKQTKGVNSSILNYFDDHSLVLGDNDVF
jgi:hypothetical protein